MISHPLCWFMLLTMAIVIGTSLQSGHSIENSTSNGIKKRSVLPCEIVDKDIGHGNIFIGKCTDRIKKITGHLFPMFEGHRTIEIITVNDTSATTIGDLGSLAVLKFLIISHSKISNITQGIFDSLKQLSMLDLSYNRITKIEKGSFLGLKVLTQLYLNNNLIEDFVEIMNLQESLEILDLISNKIENLVSFSIFKRLEAIHLKDNRIKVLRDGIFANKNVIIIDLSFNFIESIHEDTFKDTTQLSELILNDNNLYKINNGQFPLDLFVGNTFLERLNISGSNLESISIVDFKFENLKDFDITHNRIKCLPKQIFQIIGDYFVYLINNKSTLIVSDKSTLTKSIFVNASFVKLNQSDPRNLWESCPDDTTKSPDQIESESEQLRFEKRIEEDIDFDNVNIKVDTIIDSMLNLTLKEYRLFLSEIRKEVINFSDIFLIYRNNDSTIDENSKLELLVFDGLYERNGTVKYKISRGLMAIDNFIKLIFNIVLVCVLMLLIFIASTLLMTIYLLSKFYNRLKIANRYRRM